MWKDFDELTFPEITDDWSSPFNVDFIADVENAGDAVVDIDVGNFSAQQAAPRSCPVILKSFETPPRYLGTSVSTLEVSSLIPTNTIFFRLSVLLNVCLYSKLSFKASTKVENNYSCFIDALGLDGYRLC